MEKDNFPLLFYFLECYFNISADFADLPQLAAKFRDWEVKDVRDEFLEEINKFLSTADWTALEEFVRKHGSRRLNHEKLKRMMEILVHTFS